MTISVLQRTKGDRHNEGCGVQEEAHSGHVDLGGADYRGRRHRGGAPVLAAMSMVPIPLGPGMYLRLLATPGVVFVSAALVVAVNILGVLAPAYRAGRLNIVDALRYE
jgi:putative ABC transport system permease protein